jgi:hypothetical protein
MNFVGVLACVLVAWDCAEKAVGGTPQYLFAPGDLWAWWIPSGAWLVAAIGQIGRRA